MSSMWYIDWDILSFLVVDQISQWESLQKKSNWEVLYVAKEINSKLEERHLENEIRKCDKKPSLTF